MKNELKMKKNWKREIKKNWKKIVAITVAGAAVVGTGVLIIYKLKNGEEPDLSGYMSLNVFEDGMSYDADTFWDKTGQTIVKMTVEDMSVRDVSKMLDTINPDVYGISVDHPWKEIIFLRDAN